jgi:hypothetical protein
MPFAVVAGFEKHYPPLLDDEVWRLEKIGKNGAYHQALSGSGIYTVQKLLQSYKKNEQKLFKVRVLWISFIKKTLHGVFVEQAIDTGLTRSLDFSSSRLSPRCHRQPGKPS